MKQSSLAWHSPSWLSRAWHSVGCATPADARTDYGRADPRPIRLLARKP